MKKQRALLIGALVCALALSVGVLTACGQSDEDLIRESLTEELDGVKNMDSEIVSSLEEGLEDSGVDEFGIDITEFATTYLDGFDYTIDDVVVDGDTATATITITCKNVSDFEAAFEEAATEFIESDEASSLSQDELYTRLGEIAMECLQNTEPAVCEPFDVTYTLEDDTWTPDDSSWSAMANVMM